MDKNFHALERKLTKRFHAQEKAFLKNSSPREYIVRSNDSNKDDRVMSDNLKRPEEDVLMDFKPLYFYCHYIKQDSYRPYYDNSLLISQAPLKKSCMEEIKELDKGSFGIHCYVPIIKKALAEVCGSEKAAKKFCSDWNDLGESLKLTEIRLSLIAKKNKHILKRFKLKNIKALKPSVNRRSVYTK